MMRWDLVNELLAHARVADDAETSFLEIGVGDGECARRVRAKVKFGIDPAPHPRATRGCYDVLFVEESDAALPKLKKEPCFDVALVDGLHHAEQVLHDVRGALAVSRFVVMHDCNPKTELAQRVPRATKVWNGDCWKAMVALRMDPELTAFTIDADHGLGVVCARGTLPIDLVPSQLSRHGRVLTWETLEAYRAEWLGLITVDHWRSILVPT